MLPRMILVAGLAAGCGGAGTAPGTPTPAEECLLRSGDSIAGGPILAAAGGADTLLLASARRHTLIGLTCAGRPVPRVATAWSADSSRTTWTLLLPSAAEIATGWRERPEAAAALRAAGVTSVVPLDQRRLAVTFEASQDTVPGLFADPALGAPADIATDSLAIRLLPGGGDLRDALDSGAALVVTADPAVLEYAVSRSGVISHSLPWNRTYVLLAPDGDIPLDEAVEADSGRFREALARDVVRVAARGAQPPFWWENPAGCTPATIPRLAPSPIVIYPGADPVARALAERIVATAGPPGAVARGVPAGRLDAAIAGGLGWLYIVPLPRVPLVPCRELAAWPEGAAAIPLIETRLTALLRAGTPPLRVEYDGALLPAERP
ncbi:MAG TPA: hypothetical protein VMN37_11940 [Gemmatimonadales bacterium]|nr:hypothetical protein [Gemmatimonadales bacterium]